MMRRFNNDEKGVTAVEFAMVMPVFVVLVFGIIEFASIFFSYHAAGHAAWEVTRQLATNRIKVSEVDALARAQLPSWMRSQATITPNSSSNDPNTNRYTITISFPASAASTTGVVSWAYNTLTLTAKTTMQQEPTS